LLILKKPYQKLIPILAVIAGISMSGLFGWFFYKQEEKSITIEFHNDVDKRAYSLYRELVLNFEALRSLAILFNRESIPEQKLFNYEASKILSRYNDIQALEWIPRVPHAERFKYESKLKQEFPDFEFTERQAQSTMVTAEKREEYYPVYYVEPLVGNETAFGFDLGSNITRMQALEKSRDFGIPQATASITLVQESGKQKGFLAFLPVYEGIPTTAKNRRKRLKGFILGVYRIADIFSNSALGKEPLGIEMRLIDESSVGNDILHIHQSSFELPTHDIISYKNELPGIWGRQWSILATPSSSYISSRRSQLPLVIFTSSLIFTFAVALYMNFISNRSATVRKLVIEKTDELNKANRELEKLSRTDALTGAANRRYMDDHLAQEWLRAIRNKSSLSFILIDIDFFKLYNDNYGHLAGDECLKKVASELNRQINRSTDLLARYGGEEFAFVLPETLNAKHNANNYRQAIEELQIAHEFSEAAAIVTISVGLCTVTPDKGTDPSLIIAAADKALYKAKEAGRNRVELSDASTKPNNA